MKKGLDAWRKKAIAAFEDNDDAPELQAGKKESTAEASVEPTRGFSIVDHIRQQSAQDRDLEAEIRDEVEKTPQQVLDFAKKAMQEKAEENVKKETKKKETEKKRRWRGSFKRRRG